MSEGVRGEPTPDAARWTRVALALVVGTMAYNIIEAFVAIGFGSQAGSVALTGFGLDSVIETAAAGVLLRRLRLQAAGACPDSIELEEARVLRFVGVTFLLLALYVVVQSGWTLFTGAAPEESLVGVALAVASLAVMPLVSLGKLRAADRLESKALRAEAKETLACSYLSATLLVGLAANAAAGWWWADPVAALTMVPWLVKEGIEGLRGEDGEDD